MDPSVCDLIVGDSRFSILSFQSSSPLLQRRNCFCFFFNRTPSPMERDSTSPSRMVDASSIPDNLPLHGSNEGIYYYTSAMAAPSSSASMPSSSTSVRSVPTTEMIRNVDRLLRVKFITPREAVGILIVLVMDMDMRDFMRDSNRQQQEYPHLVNSFLLLACHQLAALYKLEANDKQLMTEVGLLPGVLLVKTPESCFPQVSLVDILDIYTASLPPPEQSKIATKTRPTSPETETVKHLHDPRQTEDDCVVTEAPDADLVRLPGESSPTRNSTDSIANEGADVVNTQNASITHYAINTQSASNTQSSSITQSASVTQSAGNRVTFHGNEVIDHRFGNWHDHTVIYDPRFAARDWNYNEEINHRSGNWHYHHTVIYDPRFAAPASNYNSRFPPGVSNRSQGRRCHRGQASSFYMDRFGPSSQVMLPSICAYPVPYYYMHVFCPSFPSLRRLSVCPSTGTVYFMTSTQQVVTIRRPEGDTSPESAPLPHQTTRGSRVGARSHLQG